MTVRAIGNLLITGKPSLVVGPCCVLATAPMNASDIPCAGSAWEYDEQTDEYYLHLFLKEQPDLKWDHPPVRDAVCEVMRFWLDRGCDGFRIDAINFISKPPGLPDDRSENRWNMLGLEHYANGPRLHEYLKVIGGVLREYDAFSVGDMGHLTDLDEVLRSVGADRGELAMVFHFEM